MAPAGAAALGVCLRESSACVVSLGHRFFFFSSRRRHTISLCDWSSDVCSSDLTAGEVRYRDAPLGERFREEAGILFQKTALQDFLTVRQCIALFRGLYARGLDVETVIRMCALEKLAGRDARKLSGGQQQRLLLAIALVNDPAVLFLDEPTTGLDPQARRNFWELVQSIKAQRKTIILTTHYMEEAELLCDEIVILDHGRIVAQGPPRQLLHE